MKTIIIITMLLVMALLLAGCDAGSGFEPGAEINTSELSTRESSDNGLPQSETAPVQNGTPTETPQSSQAAPETEAPAPESTEIETQTPAIQPSETEPIPTSPPKAFVDEFNDGVDAYFHLGMTKEEMKGALNEIGAKFVNEIEGPSIEDARDTDRIFWETAQDESDLDFWLNKKYILYYTGVFPKTMTTARGLKLADNYETLVALYGEPDRVYPDGPLSAVYEYDVGEWFFRVDTANDEVEYWSISLFSYEKYLNPLTGREN